MTIPKLAAELQWDDAVALSARIRAREITACEAAEAAIERIQLLNPRLNAVVLEWFERAMARAAELDHGRDSGSPLHGVPFLLKDLGVAVAGQPLYLGNRALREANFRPSWTSELARRFNALGLITLGATNTPEMGAQTTTQPHVYGPARNPWDLLRSTSGSSGGSAAAVAAGFVPIAHGNDYLGSLRLPAAWNGIIGMIASRGRVPLGPEATSRMSRELVLTRTVRDMAAVLDGIHGYAAGELWIQTPPHVPFATSVRQAPTGLKIGLLAAAPGGTKVDERYAAAVASAGAALESLGHGVRTGHPDALFEDRSQAPRFDRGSDYRRRIRIIERLLGRKAGQDEVEPFLWQMARRDGETVDSHLEAEAWQQGWAARVTSWWERDGFDILLTPTIPMPPETIEELAVPADDPTKFFEKIEQHVAFTSPFNITGQPALALPWGAPLEPGLPPASVQLVGAPGREDVVLAVAAQLEVFNGPVRHPPLAASTSAHCREAR